MAMRALAVAPLRPQRCTRSPDLPPLAEDPSFLTYPYRGILSGRRVFTFLPLDLRCDELAFLRRWYDSHGPALDSIRPFSPTASLSLTRRKPRQATFSFSFLDPHGLSSHFPTETPTASSTAFFLPRAARFIFPSGPSCSFPYGIRRK